MDHNGVGRGLLDRDANKEKVVERLSIHGL